MVFWILKHFSGQLFFVSPWRQKVENYYLRDFVTLHFNRVQEDLCLLEDGQLAVVQNIPVRHDHIPGKTPSDLSSVVSFMGLSLT